MSVDFFHLMLLNKIVPGVITDEPIIKKYTLSSEPGKSAINIPLSYGLFEVLTITIKDGGTHVGADVQFSIIPKSKTGSRIVSIDRASARMLYTQFYGNQIERIRVDRYDPDEGIYTITASFVGGNRPIFHDYDIRIAYPKKKEVGDETALNNYGAEVKCMLEGYCYKIDLDKALEAEVELLAMGVSRGLEILSKGMKSLALVSGGDTTGRREK